MRHGPGPAPSKARYKRLFVVTYGRSGSTLLQGVLNAIPGYLIRGENWDVLGHMKAFFDAAPRFDDAPASSAAPVDPLYGWQWFRDEIYAAGLARFLDRMLLGEAKLPDLRCLGFKEVRYTPQNVSERVDFLRAVYPGCGIVLNVRDPEAVAASEFQRGRPPAYFRQFNAVLEDLASVDRHACLVRYEDVITGTGTLPALFAFLREPLDRKVLADVLARKHSYHSDARSSIYSNVPASAQVNRSLQGLDVFIVDALVAQERITQIEGRLIEANPDEPRRFARLSARNAGEVAFVAEYGLPNRKLAGASGKDATEACGFRVRFTRPEADALTLYFDHDEPAVTMPRPLTST